MAAIILPPGLAAEKSFVAVVVVVVVVTLVLAPSLAALLDRHKGNTQAETFWKYFVIILMPLNNFGLRLCLYVASGYASCLRLNSLCTFDCSVPTECLYRTLWVSGPPCQSS
ncbi:hypothetical protein EI94DRAFT_1725397 [Lactarius quietus]|nr:hypothetical protein EI94DRAFT_1725397 [Lactarius quietus]